MQVDDYSVPAEPLGNRVLLDGHEVFLEMIPAAARETKRDAIRRYQDKLNARRNQTANEYLYELEQKEQACRLVVEEIEDLELGRERISVRTPHGWERSGRLWDPATWKLELTLYVEQMDFDLDIKRAIREIALVTAQCEEQGLIRVMVIERSKKRLRIEIWSEAGLVIEPIHPSERSW